MSFMVLVGYFDWLIDWVIEWLCDRLIDWVIDWLVDCVQSQFRFETELGMLLSEPAKRVRHFVLTSSLLVSQFRL